MEQQTLISNKNLEEVATQFQNLQIQHETEVNAIQSDVIIAFISNKKNN